MSGIVSHNPETRTTTLVWGPLLKPLSTEDVQLLARLQARAIGCGYAVMRAETDESITLTAVLSAPRTQPFTRTSHVSRAEA